MIDPEREDYCEYLPPTKITYPKDYREPLPPTKITYPISLKVAGGIYFLLGLVIVLLGWGLSVDLLSGNAAPALSMLIIVVCIFLGICVCILGVGLITEQPASLTGIRDGSTVLGVILALPAIIILCIIVSLLRGGYLPLVAIFWGIASFVPCLLFFLVASLIHKGQAQYDCWKNAQASQANNQGSP